MHGLIFVTWEKYLTERFGNALLNKYRAAIGETPATSPLASHVYDDAMLLAGVGEAVRLTCLPADILLREYGRYFMLNGLTSHRCAYLLTQVHSGRELLLVMRDAHAQMRRTPDAITPPLFQYETTSSAHNRLTLVYDSPRQLCAVLLGAIEGAAERYGEQVQVIERTCMKQGASACRFELYFYGGSSWFLETPEQRARQNAQQYLANLVLEVLPDNDGVTLAELQTWLDSWQGSPHKMRPSLLLNALHHLQHAGLVATTANQPDDDLMNRRYWRAPTS
jgi:Haem-NO-binding